MQHLTRHASDDSADTECRCGTSYSEELFAESCRQSCHWRRHPGTASSTCYHGLASSARSIRQAEVASTTDFIEWSEMETPVLQEARELIPDAGVAGEYRGGLGEELILRAFNRSACQPVSPDAPHSLHIRDVAEAVSDKPRRRIAGRARVGHREEHVEREDPEADDRGDSHGGVETHRGASRSGGTLRRARPRCRRPSGSPGRGLRRRGR